MYQTRRILRNVRTSSSVAAAQPAAQPAALPHFLWPKTQRRDDDYFFYTVPLPSFPITMSKDSRSTTTSWMNSLCAATCGESLSLVDDRSIELPLSAEVVGNIVTDILASSDDETKTHDALNRLYILTDSDHKENRIPLVATKNWNVIQALISCLSPSEDAEHRRLACLILNNLSIPFENKALLVLGPESESLLKSLLTIIQRGLPECYLSCICLYNLSILEDAQPSLLHFGKQHDNPTTPSLLQTIETTMKICVPVLIESNKNRKRRMTKTSIEGETVRWGTGLIRNLTGTQEGARVVAQQTQLSSILVNILSNFSNATPLEQWTEDSLQDFCLLALVNLAQWPESLQVLQRLPIKQALEPIKGKGGIHDVRASTIACKLDHH